MGSFLKKTMFYFLCLQQAGNPYTVTLRIFFPFFKCVYWGLKRAAQLLFITASVNASSSAWRRLSLLSLILPSTVETSMVYVIASLAKSIVSSLQLSSFAFTVFDALRLVEPQRVVLHEQIANVTMAIIENIIIFAFIWLYV